MEDLTVYSTADSEALLRLLRRLRSPNGCPWDRVQTRHTLSRCLRGECAELIEALDSEDPAAILDELGDVLMNIYLQILIGEEKGEFTRKEVYAHVIAKMIRRHEHVFGASSAATPEEVLALWNRVKLKEKGGEKRESALDGVQDSLSALDRAEKLQSRAAKVGFDWPDAAGAAAKVQEEAAELARALERNDDAAVDEELGDLFFAAVNLVRKRNRDTSEELLRRANYKFERRFRAMEALAAERNQDFSRLSLEEMDNLWNEIKAGEKHHA